MSSFSIVFNLIMLLTILDGIVVLPSLKLLSFWPIYKKKKMFLLQIKVCSVDSPHS